MRRAGTVRLAAVLASGLVAAAAGGDGAELRLRERAGGVVLSVWTTPVPLRVGRAEVLVVEESTGEPAPAGDGARRETGGLARVEVELWAGEERVGAVTALPSDASIDPGRATARVASIELPAAGEAELRVRRGTAAGWSDHRVRVAVAPPSSPLREHGLVLGLPFVVIALFALAQRRRRVARDSGRGPVRQST